MTLLPKEAGALIASLSEHVKIKPEGVEKLGKQLLVELEEGRLTYDIYAKHKLHVSAEDESAIDWIFIVDTLNFCFWKAERQIGFTVEGYTGYFALCAAINRARKEGVDILNPHFLQKLTKDELAHILRSDTDVKVSLLEDRLKCLHEVSTVLLEKYNGTFKTCIDMCDNSAVKLLKIVTENFPCFRDETVYKNHKVALYKRAQILIGDIWACFKGQGPGKFVDIDEISLFADYRIPQSFLYYGVLEYSDQLHKVLKENILLENGSEKEVEIRGCCIHAAELVKKWIDEQSKGKYHVNAILIDQYLWDFRREHADEILNMGIPFHKTLSIYY